jgi:hypothetical protein
MRSSRRIQAKVETINQTQRVTLRKTTKLPVVSKKSKKITKLKVEAIPK